jgi:hypothetical protein
VAQSQRKPPERRFRRGPGESLADLLARVDALLADGDVGGLATPSELEAGLFAGAELHHPDPVVLARLGGLQDGSIFGADAFHPLPRRLGQVASAFFREGNVDVIVHRGRTGLRLALVPVDRTATAAADGALLRLARPERLADGSGRPIAALALPTFESGRAVRERLRRWAGRERAIDRALHARLQEQLLRTVGYAPGGPDAPPRLERSAAVALAWETATVFREVVIARLAAELGTPVPELRVPLLLGHPAPGPPRG